jgi:ribonucleotide monophosphatase NagD (HAD superfamily)
MTVMIGDSLLTDIAGANAFGIDSVFITSGIGKKRLLHKPF